MSRSHAGTILSGSPNGHDSAGVGRHQAYDRLTKSPRQSTVRVETNLQRPPVNVGCAGKIAFGERLPRIYFVLRRVYLAYPQWGLVFIVIISRRFGATGTKTSSKPALLRDVRFFRSQRADEATAWRRLQ